MTYSQKLRDPRWQRKRLLILNRDDWACQSCKSKTNNLQVHHIVYAKRDPWDYPDDCYQTLCDGCHESRQQIADDAANRLKIWLSRFPAENIVYAADEINRHTASGQAACYRRHVVSTLHKACDLSEKGVCVIHNGLFSDSLMDFLCVQVFSGGENGESHKDYSRAIRGLEAVIEKLKAVK